MPLNINLPVAVAALLQKLRAAGYSGFVVGGCVRDSLLGRTPGDWDICTDAHPDETRAVFAGYRQLLTGEKHGTIGVLVAGRVYEITTYRLDGAYQDHRHPTAVQFVPLLRQDLARRDFTINAMAYSPETGLVDEYGGQEDLAARRLRCVGAPAHRFAEDALRILRAVRFAAQLDFALDAPTAQAALAARDTLQAISAERLYTELDKLLFAPAAGRALAQYGAILAGALPEILPCIGCTQPGRWHCYDVWQHTAVAVGALPGILARACPPGYARAVLWAVLLHDLAKPCCKTVDDAGAAHFYGHNQSGGRLAAQILARLRAPKTLCTRVAALVAIHDAPLPTTDAEILRLLSTRGSEFLGQLCAVKYADLDAHAPTPEVADRRRAVAAFESRMNCLAHTGCYRLAHLAVTGADALAAGIQPGPAVGQALGQLLEKVMQGELPNHRAALLAALKPKK